MKLSSQSYTVIEKTWRLLLPTPSNTWLICWTKPVKPGDAPEQVLDTEKQFVYKVFTNLGIKIIIWNFKSVVVILLHLGQKTSMKKTKGSYSTVTMGRGMFFMHCNSTKWDLHCTCMYQQSFLLIPLVVSAFIYKMWTDIRTDKKATICSPFGENKKIIFCV